MSKLLRNVGGIYRQLTHTRLLHNEIGVLGVPFAKGQTHQGVAMGPQRLREAGMLRKLEIMGYKVTDYGDLQFETIARDPPRWNIKNPKSIGHATNKVSKITEKIIRDGQTCLTLGGDHSLSIGSVHGHAQVDPDMVLVWVDAHADINTPITSLSGNIHGMVLSFLTHELQQYLPDVPGFEWVTPCIHAKDIAYIGLRDLDPAERHIIDKFGITCFTMHEIDRHGIDLVLERAIEAVNPGLKRPMHLSYDIDSLDPVVSPATGTPVPGGLTIREGMFIAEELALTGKLRGIDLVEVNPDLGLDRDQNLTLFAAVEVISALFGKRRTGKAPSDYQLPLP